MIMITATLPPYFNNGPIYPEEIPDSCEKTWWYNLLYVNNRYFHEPDVRSVVIRQFIDLPLFVNFFNYFQFKSV